MVEIMQILVTVSEVNCVWQIYSINSWQQCWHIQIYSSSGHRENRPRCAWFSTIEPSEQNILLYNHVKKMIYGTVQRKTSPFAGFAHETSSCTCLMLTLL